jgi:hypothetical protein
MNNEELRMNLMKYQSFNSDVSKFHGVKNEELRIND